MPYCIVSKNVTPDDGFKDVPKLRVYFSHFAIVLFNFLFRISNKSERCMATCFYIWMRKVKTLFNKIIFIKKNDFHNVYNALFKEDLAEKVKLFLWMFKKIKISECAIVLSRAVYILFYTLDKKMRKLKLL